MLNRPARLVLFVAMVFLFVPACRKTETPNAITALEEKYPDLRKKYVYQSLIRLANINHDPSFEKLIRDVRKVILYLPPSNDSTYSISTVRPAIRDEGYETLIDVRTADAQHISLWVKETGGRSHYIGLLDGEPDDVILEIDGEIHPEYLTSVTGANQSSLMNLIKGGF